METYHADAQYGTQLLVDALSVDRSFCPDSAMDASRIVARCLELGIGRGVIDIGVAFRLRAVAASGLKRHVHDAAGATVQIGTVSKVPKGNSRRRWPLRIACRAGWPVLYTSFRTMFFFNAGMFINAYFRKGEAKGPVAEL